MRNLILALMLVPSVALAHHSPIKPDPFITPGQSFNNIGLDKICSVGYSSTVRNVTNATKDKVFELYGLKRIRGLYEVDHLISLQLGGTNSISNLWPQHYFTQPWNAKVKDALENHLRREICDGKMSLQEAQKIIATDWIKAYCTHYNKKPASCIEYMNGQGIK